MELEQTYKAMVLRKYGELPQLESLSFREIKENELLVKVMATSIIPADCFNLQGSYGNEIPQLPAVFGMEGSGIIEKVGENVDKKLIGKHCGIVIRPSKENYHGVWAEYCYATVQSLVIFDKQLDFTKIFSTFVNPMTICGFLDVIKKSGLKSVAQNGASSALGRMFIKLCNKEGIEVINIVRKESTIEELKLIGGKYSVSTSDNNWEKDYSDLCKQFDVKILFDCLGGEFTSKCFNAMPNGSTLYHFGNLEKKPIVNISTADLIFKNKEIKGFWLASWLETLKHEEIFSWLNYVKRDFEDHDGEIFSTNFVKEFQLDKFADAIKNYQETSGRVLIKPNY
jgi:NADPH:quinone reductase-like Zn-dependent oxidoreductase